MKTIFFISFCFAFGLVQSQEIDPEYIDSMKQESRKRFNRDNPKETFDILDTLKAYSTKYNNYKGLFNIANDRGIFYYFMGELDSTKLCYNKAIQIGTKHKLYRPLTNLKSNFGILEEYLGNYNEAINWYLESVKTVDSIENRIAKDTMQIGKNYRNIANVYGIINDLELQEFYLKKSLKNTPNNTQMKGIVYTDFAKIKLKKREFPEVISFLEKADRENEIVKDNLLSILINTTYGNYYFEKEQYQKALTYFDKASLFTSNNSLSYEIENNMKIGLCYNKLGDSKLAEVYLDKAYNGTIKQKVSYDVELDILSSLAAVKNERKPAEIYDLLNKVITLNDSTYTQKK